MGREKRGPETDDQRENSAVTRGRREHFQTRLLPVVHANTAIASDAGSCSGYLKTACPCAHCEMATETSHGHLFLFLLHRGLKQIPYGISKITEFTLC